MTSNGDVPVKPTPHCCISHHFSTSASNNRHKIAVIHAADEGEQSSFTYADLISAVDSLTSQLRRKIPTSASSSSEPPRIIGVYIPPSVEYIVAVLAVLRLGEAFLPLDPSWPKHRLLSVVASANVDLIITSTTPFGYELDSSNLLENNNCNPSFLWFSMAVGEEESVTVPPDSDGRALSDCESEKERLFCYVMYTSGSTGKPKGVCGTEKGVMNRFQWMQEMYPLKGDEVMLFKTAISFVDHLQEFLSAILTGCALVIAPFSIVKQNVFSILDYLQDYSINRLTAVPSLMRVILPALQGRDYEQLPSSLNLLVLSGEILSLSLWSMLKKTLPRTSILNLYGSTEVSGDCTYFDCKRLPMMLETETLTSVPIGIPIVSCDVVLFSDDNVVNEGEICVAGLCNSSGYYFDSTFTPLETVQLPPNFVRSCSINGYESQSYFRTGDFAKQLRSGDLVFLGRKDRTIKLNGQRIALEEIELTLMGHPDVTDAAVVLHSGQRELMQLVAFIVLKIGTLDAIFRSSIKSWMVHKVPLAMIPGQFIIVETLPVSASGKVDYAVLEEEVFLAKHVQADLGDVGRSNLLQVIKKAFSCVLAEEVSDNDDFFMMGGNSIAAAHLSSDIGVNMRLIYSFPTPSKLCMALLERKRPTNMKFENFTNSLMNEEGGTDMTRTHHETPIAVNLELSKILSRRNENKTDMSKRLKVDVSMDVASGSSRPPDPWNSVSVCTSCSFSRCNKVAYEGTSSVNDVYQDLGSVTLPKSRKMHMEELWKINMGSCVDASPLIVCQGQDIYLFIGSHSQNFVCVNALSGSIKWEVQLEGRVECSAAILGDFSQVVVGCYKGNIYFLDSLNGNICWTFHTCGEVKSQPVIDSQRQLIWCGSYDHDLYALDYKNHCCVYQLPCGGSICGSPAIDDTNNILYVASTGGQMTALSIKASPFSTMWLLELEVPVFGSLAINSLNGNVICCLVDGHVLALSTSGSIIWRYKTAGPVFAGACISSSLPFQVLVCSRDGSIYSLELETGGLLWEYDVKDPITSSAYVDEHLSLVPDQSKFPDSRVVCVCSSSGSMVLIRVNFDLTKFASPINYDVEEFARLELAGDVFSSPVMIGGRIFLGCRDDYVHCIAVKP